MTTILSSLRRHPLIIAGVAGAVLAWPQPTRVLPAALATALALAVVVTDWLRPARMRRFFPLVGLLGLVALSIWNRPTEPAAGLAALIGATLALGHAWGLLTPPRRFRGSPALWWTTTLALIAIAVPHALPVPSFVMVVPLLAIMALDIHRRRSWSHLLDGILAQPARLLVIGFAALAGAGGLLLSLPVASTAPGSISLLDALFTSVSATCVTGLTVRDTPTDFTIFGQAVILGLIQLGGLGIMTFASAVAVYMGRRLRVREEAVAAELLGTSGVRRDIDRALRTVVRVAVVSELLGAGLLSLAFRSTGDDWLMAVWRGLFTSVSAFCNAGFALQSDSLIPYRETPAVLLTVGTLIILGGLGPMVVIALPALRRRHPKVTLHLRLVVVTTLGLVLTPAVIFLAVEWTHTLAGLGFADKVVNAWFQSVTLRTAGFNSIDTAAIQPASWSVSVLCMFVGGSPGSTAGGIKTTTLAVLILAVTAAIRGRREAEAFGRRIPHRTVYEAAAITTVFMMTAAGSLLAVQLTQQIPLESAVFEVVSALGTVGLSMGATHHLDGVGKIVIAATMFAGRVGPLTMFVFLMERSRPSRRYPIESVPVG